MTIEIRPARSSDAQAISALSAEVQALHARELPELFKPPSAGSFPETAVRELLDEQNRIILVACAGGAVVGYASARLEHRDETPFRYPATSLCVQWMGVRAGWRRQGIGSLLIKGLRDAAVSKGATSLILDVWASNKDAWDFYHAVGFRASRHILTLDIT